MTEEAQRIAIAEACGWTKIGLWGNASMSGDSPVDGCTRHLPDYTGSLDAMHEAEKVLTDEQFENYAFWLSHVTPPEAFLRTLNLWTTT